MIDPYAAEQVMLPRTLAELYENVGEFTVAAVGGKVIGCGALKFYSAELAEIRSLCVGKNDQTRGLGRGLTERLLGEAEGHGLKVVFALTLARGFFLKCGFREVPRASVPMKVWRDCIHCDKYFHCNPKTMIIDLSCRSSRQVSSRSAASQVSA
jgi:amino-acid N-acetyltransferase